MKIIGYHELQTSGVKMKYYVISTLMSHFSQKINIKISSEHSIKEVQKSYHREDCTCAERMEVHILIFTEEED